MWPFSLLLVNVFLSKRWLVDLVDPCDYDNVDLMPLPTDGFLSVVSLCRAVLTLRTRGSRRTWGKSPFSTQDISRVSFVPVKSRDSTDSLSRVTTQWKHSTTKSITNTFFLIHEGKNGVPVLKTTTTKYTSYNKKTVFLTFFVVTLGVNFKTEDVLRDGPCTCYGALSSRLQIRVRIHLINLAAPGMGLWIITGFNWGYIWLMNVCGTCFKELLHYYITCVERIEACWLFAPSLPPSLPPSWALTDL